MLKNNKRRQLLEIGLHIRAMSSSWRVDKKEPTGAYRKKTYRTIQKTPQIL